MNETTDMSFWSLSIPGGGKAAKYEIEASPAFSQFIHVTNVCLPPNPAAGSYCLTITVRNQEIAVAHLSKDTHPQHALDFVLDAGEHAACGVAASTVVQQQPARRSSSSQHGHGHGQPGAHGAHAHARPCRHRGVQELRPGPAAPAGLRDRQRPDW